MFDLLPNEIICKIAIKMDQKTFVKFSNLNRRLRKICEVVKFPVDEIAFWNDNDAGSAHIVGPKNFSSFPSKIFEENVNEDGKHDPVIKKRRLSGEVKVRPLIYSAFEYLLDLQNLYRPERIVIIWDLMPEEASISKEEILNILQTRKPWNCDKLHFEYILPAGIDLVIQMFHAKRYSFMAHGQGLPPPIKFSKDCQLYLDSCVLNPEFFQNLNIGKLTLRHGTVEHADIIMMAVLDVIYKNWKKQLQIDYNLQLTLNKDEPKLLLDKLENYQQKNKVSFRKDENEKGIEFVSIYKYEEQLLKISVSEEEDRWMRKNYQITIKKC